ncbi:MAG: right-handed parallel beta-helix repeat-containing protein, partial [Chitinophagaceae bacterium]|nr:right-handed parallel beta-helix repeat-containing protein [Chitinophagaceae bacterium]
MKNFVVLIIELCVVFLLFSNTVFANKYYFSSSIGNDSYSEVEAQNPATPWKTLGKLNSIMSILAPGDSVLFKKGDVFYGKIVVTKSGTSSQPIVFSSFGSGEEPLITGLTELFNWNSVGGGIMAANCNDCRETNNMLLFDNKLQRIGRYPNSGYLQYQSFSGTNSITSDQLPAGIDWTGAELVVRKKDWILERNKITSQQGGTLYFSTDSKYPGTNNYGFFIQRDRRTLDSLGEWYFVKESKAMWVYFGRENPADHQVKVSTIDTLVYILRQSYITFDGIAFEGGSQYTISINYSKFIKIQNSTLNYSGNRAIKCGGCEDFTLANSSISNTLNVGVDLTYSGVRTNIINNHIKNTGCIEGLGDGGMDSYMGISPAKDFSRISNNRIDSTGFVPIRFNESNTIVEENFINTFCFIKDDAGGIYTSGPHEKDQEPIIRNNIVVNGIGAPNGANGRVIVRGIYADEFSSHVSIIGNTVAKVNGGGIFLHRANNVDVENNKSFDNLYCIMYHQRKLGEFFSNTIKNNQFVAKNNDQVAVFFYMEDGSDNPSTWGTIDSNYYSRPNNEDSRIVRVAAGAEVRYFNPAGWNLYSGLDKASGPSKAVGDSMSEVRLVYNPSNVEKSYSLDGTYQSIDGNFYYGSVTLPPYQSVILVKLLEINKAPIANAGPEQIIILPQDKVTLVGSGTDEDGEVVGYEWTKSTWSIPHRIVTSNSPVTEVTGLSEGTFIIQLKVTDNKGASATSSVRIIVKAAPNKAPTANAGQNQTITLPINTVTLNGSGTDEDGTITAYEWTKVSGPNSYTIVSPASATTEVKDLTEGSYTFQLKVTDNKGATGTATVKVTVNPAPNKPPKAYAGADKTITLPTSTVSLAGSGEDEDGTIVSYKWTKVSGPSAYNIVNPNSAVTDAFGLVEGVYEFQLEVTDNKGAKGRDTMKVTVNAAPNKAPKANAGQNQTITLPTNTVTLNGIGTDEDGTITAYEWTKTAGPNSYTIVSPNYATTEVKNLTEGTYTFQLKVTDDKGATGTATVKVTVNPAPNKAPTANAGQNQTITLPINTVTLNGSGTDEDGSITAYEWTKTAGPTSYTIVSPNSATTEVRNLTEGTYTFQLKVTDDKGATGTATVKVTVNPAPNKAPTANAGQNQTITLPTSTVTLNGSGTDEDGTITAYEWTKTAGPTGYTIVSPNSATTEVRNLTEGTYTFQLKVTDNRGTTGTATVKVTVNPAPNKPPKAYAGADKTITLPTSTVSLAGSG